ncbi:MAG: KH domain-containing protein [Candidatus Micrarchaeota archaeon]
MSRIVFPGEVIADKPVRASYSYTDGTKTYATVISLMSDEGKLVPLHGPYEPLAEDVVIGFVSDVRFAGYTLDLGAPFTGFFSNRDTRLVLALGDIVQVRILNVDEVKSIDLADGRKLENGAIERISPVKVPRLIGKRNSMINMIAYASGCQIIVGRNGFVFVSHTGNHALARQAINFVAAHAHTSGLTDRVASMLSEACGKPISPDVIPAPAPAPSGGYGNTGGPSYGGERREGSRSGGHERRREGGFGGDSRRREGGRWPFGHRRDGPREGANSQYSDQNQSQGNTDPSANPVGPNDAQNAGSSMPETGSPQSKPATNAPPAQSDEGQSQ